MRTKATNRKIGLRGIGTWPAAAAAMALLGAVACEDSEIGQPVEPGAVVTEGVREAAERPGDRELAQSVVQELAATPATALLPIGVAAEDGVVTLSGIVDSLAVRREAVERASILRGVLEVEDLIEVDPPEVMDSVIHDQIFRALVLDPTTDQFDLEVAVDDGVVTLNGSVDSFSERQLAGSVAARVRGVRELDNQIEVEPVLVRLDQEIEADALGALARDPWLGPRALAVDVDGSRVVLSGEVGTLAELQRARELACVIGCSSIDTSQVEIEPALRFSDRQLPPSAQRGEALSDQLIAERLWDALLRAPSVETYDVEAQVEDGVVTLTGSVDSLSAKREALRVAAAVVGEEDVVEELWVAPPQRLSDEDVQARIEEMFDLSAVVSDASVTPVVVRGQVHLYGTADTPFAQQEAERLASMVSGVRAVENQIIINDYGIEPTEDWTIQNSIEGRLAVDPRIDDRDDLEVTVSDRVARIIGTVSSDRARLAAVEQAYLAGARHVLLFLEGPSQREK